MTVTVPIGVGQSANGVSSEHAPFALRRLAVGVVCGRENRIDALRDASSHRALTVAAMRNHIDVALSSQRTQSNGRTPLLSMRRGGAKGQCLAVQRSCPTPPKKGTSAGWHRHALPSHLESQMVGNRGLRIHHGRRYQTPVVCHRQERSGNSDRSHHRRTGTP